MTPAELLGLLEEAFVELSHVLGIVEGAGEGADALVAVIERAISEVQNITEQVQWEVSA